MLRSGGSDLGGRRGVAEFGNLDAESRVGHWFSRILEKKLFRDFIFDHAIDGRNGGGRRDGEERREGELGHEEGKREGVVIGDRGEGEKQRNAPGRRVQCIPE